MIDKNETNLLYEDMVHVEAKIVTVEINNII